MNLDERIEDRRVLAELGVMRWVPSAADFMRDEMALFEQRGLNHAF